jgi:hypothetical protein
VLAIAGFLLVVSSTVLWLVRLRLGRFRRYPYEQYVLVAASVVFGLLAAIANPNAVTLGLLALEVAVLALVVWYLGVGSPFPDEQVGIQIGQRFPDFTLLDSEGKPFHSRVELRDTAALYISYRGHT